MANTMPPKKRTLLSSKTSNNDVKKAKKIRTKVANEDDLWHGVPAHVQDQVVACIDQWFSTSTTTTGMDHGSSDRSVEVSTLSLSKSIQQIISPILYSDLAVHTAAANDSSKIRRLIDDLKDRNDIFNAMNNVSLPPATASLFTTKSSSKKQQDQYVFQMQRLQLEKKHNLMKWFTNTYRTLQKAIRVYDLIDVQDKGCIIIEDMIRVIKEEETISSTISPSDEIMNEDDIRAMMTEFTSTSTNSNSLDDDYVALSIYDIVYIAKLVNL